MRLREAKSFFHRSGYDCVQKSMRSVLEFTKVGATSFVQDRQDRLKFESDVGLFRRHAHFAGWTSKHLIIEGAWHSDPLFLSSSDVGVYARHSIINDKNYTPTAKSCSAKVIVA